MNLIMTPEFEELAWPLGKPDMKATAAVGLVVPAMPRTSMLITRSGGKQSGPALLKVGQGVVCLHVWLGQVSGYAHGTT